MQDIQQLKPTWKVKLVGLELLGDLIISSGEPGGEPARVGMLTRKTNIRDLLLHDQKLSPHCNHAPSGHAPHSHTPAEPKASIKGVFLFFTIMNFLIKFTLSC